MTPPLMVGLFLYPAVVFNGIICCAALLYNINFIELFNYLRFQ